MSSNRARVHDVAPPGRSTRSLYFSKVVDERLSSERVPHPGARGRAVFVSSGAGVVGRSRNPLWCSARSNNIFHSLFDPTWLQVSPRTPMDTPTLIKTCAMQKGN
ncbi:hypothetical protein DY000_02060553 [Brassica cretica]|uniref:Uncharacterized protein n=1 Tax=Brassica cretica TaxID=69181 RepID=A0ABQ7AZ45_BRACR|nr:hypothetical protein DY000_02060553 [Brassica cretica]